jgi:hypothetical protein
MDDATRERADGRLDAALKGGDVGDPRPFYRPALRYLRESDETAFRRALDYHEKELVPAVAGDADPLRAWADYGLVLARSLGPGRLADLDATGRARSVDSPDDAAGLLLYIPDAAAPPVLVLRYPAGASPAQRAAYELLVEGRQTASAYTPRTK